jgi:hypothetical protein
MNTIDMNAIGTNTGRAPRRRAAISIVVALTLGFAATTVLVAATNVTNRGIFASVGDYLTEAGEALGAE